MAILSDPPEWRVPGQKPPQNIIEVLGWEVASHPPAPWFNWFFHRVFESLLELESATLARVVNEAGVPSIMAGPESERPAASQETVGRIYIATDTKRMFRDRGDGWELLNAPDAIGAETPAGAQAKADEAEARAKAYTDQEVAEVNQALDAHKAAAAPHSGHATTTALDNHVNDKNNPHGVTAAQVGAAPASNNAGFRNSIYRGKFLGNQVTPEQYARIADGTFEDMYIGDYWIINGTRYYIAAFNYYLDTGDVFLTKNHITLVPAGILYSHRMNPTNTTEGGYVGSEMYISGLDQARAKIHADFAGHVITHRRYLCNAAADGQASAGAWFDSDVELMNEVMVYGSVVNGKGAYGLYNIGIEKSQLPLFSLRPDLLNTTTTWWLRDVCSATSFAQVHGYGYAYVFNASNVTGVRPVFSISA